MPKRKMTIYVDKVLTQKLKAEKERTGASKAEIVRRALREYLDGK